MPGGLINLRTDLKSLRFGNDRPDGGNSGQPYVVTDIPVNDNFNTNNDFVLRDGAEAVVATADDLLRLGKFFTDLKSPKGLIFIAKQEELSRISVRTEASTGFLNAGLYTPAQTLAEAAVAYLDQHLPNENYLNDSSKYYGVVVKNNDPENLNNRLVSLYNSNIISETPDPINVLTYQGGPGSILGIGSTRIALATQPDFANPNSTLVQTGKQFQKNGDNFAVLTEQQIASQSINSTRSAPAFAPAIQDFRKTLRTSLNNTTSARTSTILSNVPDYTLQNIENRLALGDPGNRTGKNLYSYVAGGGTEGGGDPTLNIWNSYGAASNDSFDKINSLPLYRSELVKTDVNTNDLVSFRIAVIDNDDPSFKTFMHFRAFLNGFQDSHNGEWNAVKYTGRGEKFWNYDVYSRGISLSWTVAAQSKAELIPMYKKLNYLASCLAPDYSANGFMRGVLVQLTVGGYLYEQPGFITNLVFDIPEESTWEIAIDENGNNDESVRQLPHVIKVNSFNFTPIHTFIPSKQSGSFNTNNGFINSYGNQQFISLNNNLLTSSYNQNIPNPGPAPTPAEENLGSNQQFPALQQNF